MAGSASNTEYLPLVVLKVKLGLLVALFGDILEPLDEHVVCLGLDVDGKPRLDWHSQGQLGLKCLAGEIVMLPKCGLRYAIS